MGALKKYISKDPFSIDFIVTRHRVPIFGIPVRSWEMPSLTFTWRLSLVKRALNTFFFTKYRIVRGDSVTRFFFSEREISTGFKTESTLVKLL